MNWDRIEGNWKQFAGHAQKRWGKLTHDQMNVTKGNRDILAGKIQEHYGVSKDVAERQIKDWSDALKEDLAS